VGDARLLAGVLASVAAADTHDREPGRTVADEDDDGVSF
jgi:hypothetical protein